MNSSWLIISELANQRARKVLFTCVVYTNLLKKGSLDNAIREFSLAKPSWYMNHYTMIYKNGERMRDFLGLFISYCSLVFYILGAFLIKTIIPLALAGYEMIIGNSALHASSAIYHLL